MSVSNLFTGAEQFPNSTAEKRLAGLVGHDERIAELVTNAITLLDQRGIEEWSKKTHGRVLPAVTALLDRAPIFVFAGDVGVGKTEVAEVLGQAIATHTNLGVTLYPLSLTTRGRGAVGEMTTLLTSAFELLRKDFGGVRDAAGTAASMGILLIDEADAIAQSRELNDMHHEDRVGVNALLRGVDSLRGDRLPILTILCTNRVDSLDPAVLRRAAAIYMFKRPSEEQRFALLTRLLEGTDITDEEMKTIVVATGETEQRPYGYTYSDLRQRLVPELASIAYRRNQPINFTLVEEVLAHTPATRPFGNNN